MGKGEVLCLPGRVGEELRAPGRERTCKPLGRMWLTPQLGAATGDWWLPFGLSRTMRQNWLRDDKTLKMSQRFMGVQYTILSALEIF